MSSPYSHTLNLSGDAIGAPNPKAARAVADGKAPLHLLERTALEAEARVLEGGGAKYGTRNYRDTEMPMTTYVGAMLRHVLAWGAGEDNDPDTGESHLAHLRANTAVLFGAAEAGTLRDDRLDKHTTAASDAVHVDGDREAKSGSCRYTSAAEYNGLRNVVGNSSPPHCAEWPEPAGEHKPTARSGATARCPRPCGQVCACWDFDRAVHAGVGGGDMTGDRWQRSPVCGGEPAPFMVRAKCCVGSKLDDGCYGCSRGPWVAS